MVNRRTSITERLRKSQKRATRLQMATEWAEKWEQDYIATINQLQAAFNSQDDDGMIEAMDALRKLNQPKFEALPRVITELVHPTRLLIED